MDNLTSGNPVAHRVRVYYTGDDTLYEGEPLCYSFKTTKGWFGGSVSDAGVVTASERVAEGSHNESKYMCVESPMRASTTTATSTTTTPTVLTDDGAEFDNLHVGMAVSVASGTDSAFDGNYVITAVSAANNTITLDMTTAEIALVTAQSDVTVQIDNISAFAGVVAKGGWVGKTGPMVIDIYVPNGAVVPVRNDQNCVLGRTILAINSNEQHLTAPLSSYARPVAIAWETVDTATTTGLCLAKLDPNIFLYQQGDNAALLVDDQDTGNMVVNRIHTTFSQASGWCQALSISSTVSASTSNQTGVWVSFKHQGTGADGFHIMQVRGWAEGTAVTGNINGIYVQVDLKASSAILTPGIATGIFAKVHAKTGGGSHTGDIVAGRFELGLDDDTTGHKAMLYFGTAGSGTPDYFFKATDAACVALTADSGLSSSHAIKIRVGGVDYNIMCDACD